MHLHKDYAAYLHSRVGSILFDGREQLVEYNPYQSYRLNITSTVFSSVNGTCYSNILFRVSAFIIPPA